MLLTKRQRNLKAWAIPSGYMQIDEDIYQTIIRETKEETSINIKPTGIISLRQRFTEKEGNNIWIIILAEYLSGEVNPDGIEIAQAEFMNIAESLKQSLTPATKTLLTLLKNNKLNKLIPQKELNSANYLLFA